MDRVECIICEHPTTSAMAMLAAGKNQLLVNHIFTCMTYSSTQQYFKRRMGSFLLSTMLYRSYSNCINYVCAPLDTSVSFLLTSRMIFWGHYIISFGPFVVQISTKKVKVQDFQRSISQILYPNTRKMNYLIVKYLMIY